MIEGSGERLKSALDSGSNEIEITNGQIDIALFIKALFYWLL